MTLISPATLTRLAAIQETALPETVTIRRAALVDDGYGNVIVDWDNATEVDVPGRITRTGQTPQERDIADKAQAVIVYTIRVPRDTDVVETDRLVVNGRSFEIIGVIRESYPTILRIVAVESVPVTPGFARLEETAMLARIGAP